MCCLLVGLTFTALSTMWVHTFSSANTVQNRFHISLYMIWKACQGINHKPCREMFYSVQTMSTMLALFTNRISLSLYVHTCMPSWSHIMSSIGSYDIHIFCMKYMCFIWQSCMFHSWNCIYFHLWKHTYVFILGSVCFDITKT